MNISQKGAMFGLDARIALAIFGALSVITGASLYSAIKEAKVVAIVTELDNVGKAVTSFYLDTGVYPSSNLTDIFLDAEQMVVDPTIIGWNGPYVSFEDSATAKYLDHSIYTNVALIGMLDGVAWNPVVASETGKCLNASATCSVYACLNGLPDDLKIGLDLKVDGNDSDDDGNFRYSTTSAEFGCLKVMTYDPSYAAVS